MIDVVRYLHNVVLRGKWALSGVFISQGVRISIDRQNTLSLSKGVKIGFGSLLIVSDERSQFCPPYSRLSIGRNSAINEYCNLRAAGGVIEIGENCLLAQMITIVASNHSIKKGVNIIDQPWSDLKISVKIGDDVWIGANAVILPGTVIESGAIIAAGAVVRGRVLSNEIWGGVPARRLGQRVESQ